MIRRKKKKNTLIVCSELVVSLKTTMEKSGYDVRNISDGRTHTVCWYGGRFWLWAFSGINTGLFLVYVLCICNLLNSVTILCDFCVNYSPPQIRNTFAPSWGILSSKGNEFYTLLSFSNLRCLCNKRLFVIDIKLCVCFEKCYDFFPKFNNTF
jgi:hypothetical protein